MEKIQKQLAKLDMLLWEIKMELLLIRLNNLIKQLGDTQCK